MRFTGRKISGGRVEGVGLVSSCAISFLGDIDPKSGLIADPNSDIFGTSVQDKILIFPHGRGSTVGSYVMYGAKKNGRAPLAIINEKAEPVVATGAVISNIPMIDGIDVGLFKTGDRIIVDADNGFMDVSNVESKRAVTSFLLNRGEVLILRRSKEVGTQKGKWAGVSGYLEENENPETRSRQEIAEETGIEKVVLKRKEEPMLARGNDTIWEVHAFLYEVDTREVTLDWEHVEYRWIKPEDLANYDRVSRLRRALNTLMKS